MVGLSKLATLEVPFWVLMRTALVPSANRKLVEVDLLVEELVVVSVTCVLQADRVIRKIPDKTQIALVLKNDISTLPHRRQ
jgi:hypothetical protein